MTMYGQYHEITLRYKDNRNFLLGGFLRFWVAIELGWKEIEAKIYFNLSDFDAFCIEITENTNRVDFTSYELVMAIGKTKELWEKENPHSRRGKYKRIQSKNQSITDYNFSFFQFFH